MRTAVVNGWTMLDGWTAKKGIHTVYLAVKGNRNKRRTDSPKRRSGRFSNNRGMLQVKTSACALCAKVETHATYGRKVGETPATVGGRLTVMRLLT